MEIFTSITFWIIVIAIIVILAIIGYVAEGTILASQKTKKEENKKEEKTLWEKNAPTEQELKQEKVYTAKGSNWLDMPDLNQNDVVSAPVINPKQGVQEPVQSMPSAQPINPEPVQNVQPQVEPVQNVQAQIPVQPVEPLQNVQPTVQQVSPQPVPAPETIQSPQPVPSTPQVENTVPVITPAPVITPIDAQNNQNDNNVWTN